MNPEVIILLESLMGIGVIGLSIEQLKKLGLPSKYAPLTSFVLGMLVGLFLGTYLGGLSLLEGVAAGFALGGVTSGAYDQIKALRE